MPESNPRPNPVIPPDSLFAHSSIRAGQLDFYLDAKSAAREGRILFANAPTGIGKTAASLSAVLEEAIPAGRKVLFLTNRNSHHIQAMLESRAISENRAPQLAALRPLRPKIVVIDKISKEKMCLRLHGKSERPPFLLCEIAHCKYQNAKKEHIDLVLGGHLSSTDAAELGAKEGFCAHQVALAASREADLLICDYSYIFDADIRDIVFSKMNAALKNCDVIIDEAHNLPERVRSIGEHAIDERTVRMAIRGLAQIKKMAQAQDALLVAEDAELLSHHLRTIISPGIISAVAGTYGEDEVRIKPAELSFIGKKCGQMQLTSSKGAPHGAVEKSVPERIDFALGFFLESVAKEPEDADYGGVLSLRELSEFLKAAGEAARGNRRWGVFVKNGPMRGAFIMKTILFDPSEISAYVFGEIHSCVLMSGTLLGKGALRGLLGIPESRCAGMDFGQYESPFDPSRQLISVCTSASSRLSSRSDAEKMAQMGWIISEAAQACHPHSLAIFYPSYEYMEMLSPHISLPGYAVEKEVKKEGQARVEARKGRLEGNGAKGKPLALHAVVGGAYYEGMDFRNNPLKLIVLAGYPYPKVSPPHKAYEEFLSSKFGSAELGRKYASVLPASIRSLQAIGRGIRKQEDWCYCLLIDDRFTANLEFIPQGMRERLRKVQPDMLSDDVAAFVLKMAQVAQE